MDANVEMIDVLLVSAETGPTTNKVPLAQRLSYWAMYGGLSYASLKGFELYRGMHASTAFEVGEAAITGAAAAACMIKILEADRAKKSEETIPTT